MTTYDIILRNGTLYDGSGDNPMTGDLGIQGDRIAAIGDLGDASGTEELDVTGLAVAPGFINMLSWSVESLIEDGRSQSEIRQGVTLEIMGEGFSFGPFSEDMVAAGTRGILGNHDIEYDVTWRTLGEYLEFLEKRGVSTNVASFVGTATIRIYTIGYDDRPPTPEELDKMRELVRLSMEEGAMGLSSALIYPPASYAETDELIELAKVTAEYNGLYISHIRSEANSILKALDEFFQILREAKIRGEIYHLKASGQANWHKLDEVITRIETAQADGLQVTADMYPYHFSGTGLNSLIPDWAHDGGNDAMLERFKDPETRERIKADMNIASDDWENMWTDTRSPDNVLLAGFKSAELKPLIGKTLGDVIRERGTTPEDTVMDLLIEDGGRIFCMYFTMSEDNIRKKAQLPWVSFCSDAESQATEGKFLGANPHPRAYGSFARVLGRFVRDEGLITLQEAVRRLTTLPASVLKIQERGGLKPGYFADIAVFDPNTIQDHATPTNPHQYATGMVHVFVNGEQVLKDGEHTGALPGRVVHGPGWKR